MAVEESTPRQLGIRVNGQLFERLERVVAKAKTDPHLRGYRVNRATVLKNLISRGLDELEPEYGIRSDDAA